MRTKTKSRVYVCGPNRLRLTWGRQHWWRGWFLMAVELWQPMGKDGCSGYYHTVFKTI